MDSNNVVNTETKSTVILLPRKKEDMQLLKTLGCTHCKITNYLNIPKNWKGIKKYEYDPSGGAMGGYSTCVTYELFNKKNKMMCRLITYENGDISYQKLNI